MKTEKLFSYGTLRYKSVQIATFGRELEGTADRLTGCTLSSIKIQDSSVVATSGDEEHPIIIMTDNVSDYVEDVVFDITAAELVQADSYEVSDYKRIEVQLSSGISAWVYVNAGRNDSESYDKKESIQ